ncbi:GntR family transcriptional regulator [Actinopolymorpha pittospori]
MREAVRPVSIVEAVCAAIRERILTGELEPATVLYEQATADMFGVARPTAKAAIDRLVSGGLLRRSANRPAYVPRLTEEDVHDLYFSRFAIETRAVSFLASSGERPERAEQALREFDSAVRGTSVHGIVSSDIAFHHALVESVGSPRMLRMYDSIIGEAQMCMVLKQTHRLLSSRSIAREHRQIFNAIVAGDADGAQAALERHLVRSERVIRSHVRAADSTGSGTRSVAD